MADPYADDTLPEQPTGRDAIVAAMMSPQQKFNLARQGIDTGPETPTPEEIEAVRARTANTRGLASQGWEAGTQPIIPYDWATQENMPNPASGILHNIATMPAAAADTMLRGARGAYLGGVGALAGGAGDLGLEPHPDQLARAIPEGLNVLGAATAQPEFGMLPRFPAATRFATKYPGEVMGDLAAPYAKAFESAYQTVPEGAAGLTGARLKQPVAAPYVSGGSGLVDQYGLAIKGKDYNREAQRAMEEVARQGQGAGPLDLTGQNTIPNVPQVALPRYQPARGVSQRMQDALQMPQVQQGVDASITAGMGLGSGMEKWYHTQPIRSAWVDELGPRQGEPAFSGYMGQASGTSPRSAVPENIRNASYYYQRALNGEPLPDPLPYPYGHLAQNLHRQNFDALTSGGWDVLKNPKPPSYRANLEGNLIPVAADAHAFKNITMRTEDPRFLETSTREVVKPGKSLTPFQQEYGDIKLDDKGRTVVTFRPQQLVEGGRMSMKQAIGEPTFWAAVPNANEYGAVEDFWSRLGRARGLQPAQAQSAGWAGGGGLTGLGTSPTHTFPEMFNERTLFTSLMRNEVPEDTLRYLIRGQKPLLGLAGAGAVASQIDPRQIGE